MAALNSTNTGIPPPSQTHLDKGYGSGMNGLSRSYAAPPHTSATDFGSASQPAETSILSQSLQQNSGKFSEEWDASQRGSSIIDGHNPRSTSAMSQGDTLIPSRGGTLKKKASLKRQGSFKRSSSRRSSRAGSVRSLVLQPGDVDEVHSAFFSPIPTSGSPTEILANRFQAWRKILKDLITYFREIQASYDQRAKSILKVANVINNTPTPMGFLQTGGLDDAAQILRAYHKNSIAEANKSKDIENDVILALVGLRSDLNQKIKEIKSLSGDFKNSVEKEMEQTRRVVNELQEGLGQSDIDTAAMTGKKDPYLLKLAVDRQIEKQIDEENYLHQAYINIEASGRELESIVVGEIQKSYNAYAGILKREADSAMGTVEDLRTGPIAMPKDEEWESFVKGDEHFVDPSISVRQAQNIYYPGRDNELAQEVRAGLLERKSKYLKSYTAGWYVLSPTHLHEFKSADKSGAPIMSLYLPEQKLGSHSNEGASSNKFMLKGRQTGAMHRGHSWVFRCESHETMLAWYEDIKALTEKSPQERNAFVRQHARSFSGTSQKAGSVSSDGITDEDEEPFSATSSALVAQGTMQDGPPRRPVPGGRFPSDIEVARLSQRGLQAPLSPSSGSSGYGDVQDPNVAAASALPGSGIGQHYAAKPESPTHAQLVTQQAREDGINPYTGRRLDHNDNHERHDRNENYNYRDQYDEQVSPAVITAAGVGGAGLGASSIEAYRRHQMEQEQAAKETEMKRNFEHQAAIESSAIAAQDIKEPTPAPQSMSRELEHQAAIESSAIASPDTKQPILAPLDATVVAAPDAITTSEIHNMSGGRSEGDLSGATVMEPVKREAEAVKPIGEITKDGASDAIDPMRPTLAAGQNHQSVMSISQLHVPGEFPRTNSMADASVGSSVAGKRLPV